MPAAKDVPGYRAMHSRLLRLMGPASDYQCVVCDQRAEQWCYDYGDVDQLDSPLGVYSLDPARYWPLCRPHHWELDRLVLTVDALATSP